MFPRVVVNCKVYPQVTGLAVQKLAALCQGVADEGGVEIGLAPPAVELAALARSDQFPSLQFFAQHVDPLIPGSGTGGVTVEGALGAGAQGTILNHAERKLDRAILQATVARCVAEKLPTMLCADSLQETKFLASLHPTAIAIEPPELIGGTVSVTSANPTIVSDGVAAVQSASPKTLTYCGAGVKTGQDVEAALALGAYGVLLASGVVCADDPADALRNLIAGLA